MYKFMNLHKVLYAPVGVDVGAGGGGTPNPNPEPNPVTIEIDGKQYTADQIKQMQSELNGARTNLADITGKYTTAQGKIKEFENQGLSELEVLKKEKEEWKARELEISTSRDQIALERRKDWLATEGAKLGLEVGFLSDIQVTLEDTAETIKTKVLAKKEVVDRYIDERAKKAGKLIVKTSGDEAGSYAKSLVTKKDKNKRKPAYEI